MNNTRFGTTLLALCRPDGANGLFLAEAVWCCGAGLVHSVPTFAVGGPGDDTHAGHFHVAVRVVLTHAVPRVTQPVVARVLGLLREPRDFIPAPDPETALAGFAGMAAAAVVIELHEIRQLLATPTTRRDAAAAATVNGVGVADSQLRLFRFVRNLLDAQREGVEIEEQLAVANQSTMRHMRVAQNEMAPRVFRRVTARLR